LFGPNANLNIGGSFVGSTAESFTFKDGSSFGVNNASLSPLLTVSTSVGLQMGSQPAAINVQGSGHQLAVNAFAPINRSSNPPGLQAGVGSTFVLIGGGVNLSRGVVAVNSSGHIEIGSVRAGQVELDLTGQRWEVDYSAVSQFADIQLAQQSLLDASGINSSIHLQGQSISLTEGSATLLQNFGTQPSGGITINAAGELNLTGNTPDGRVGSLVVIDNLGLSQTQGITISAAQLSIRDGSRLNSRAYTPAPSGNLNIDVTGEIEINGAARGSPIFSSSISTSTYSSSNSGNIKLSGSDLSLSNGATISTNTFSSGQAGLIQVEATDTIEIAGSNAITLVPSLINSSTIGNGDANNVSINTSRLVIREGGLLGSNTLFTGAAGNVNVQASESIEVSGRATGSVAFSRIVSTAETLDPATQSALRLPAIPQGNAGSLTINTPLLQIMDGALISVKNDGPGTAGNIDINANTAFLDNQGRISAAAQSGEGGNIFLQGNALVLRRNSLINATAGGMGDGGNISLDVLAIAGAENSDITANAIQGNGGNIQITTQGIFGLEFRDQLTSESDITASSQFGVNGTVTINNPNVDADSGIVELPENVVDLSNQVATGCAEQANNRFVATGRGG
ncbi:two-partner secretion domain-containing protein, partial [Almyronema epifaneia]